MSEPKIHGPHVHRPAASATWKHEHRWGTGFGDSTTLRVTRIADGGLRIAYGNDEFEIRSALVEIAAQMVAEAAAWTDGPADHAADQGPRQDAEGSL